MRSKKNPFKGRPFTAAVILWAVRRLVAEGLAEPTLVKPAHSLRAIAARLEEMRIRTPRRGTTPCYRLRSTICTPPLKALHRRKARSLTSGSPPHGGPEELS